MNKLFEGYLNIARDRQGTLWKIPFDRSTESYGFPDKLIKKYHLLSGVRLLCEIADNKVIEVLKICGLSSAEFAERRDFKKLTASNPDQKFDFGSSENISVRILDLITPIGKGTRGLIVSPPRAGKTLLLEAISNELYKINSSLRVIVLLIDERPEEVTSFKMNTKADVFHSSLDKGSSSHILLSSFLISHVKVELECGNDTVILIDSLTRMGRAYNINDNRHNNRIMSGGLSSGALELPRKLFGLARNIQNGGSCTILATILTDTGSRMDEVIFQEFKGTGNCEIVLDRDLADLRIFPAINITESGTRKEELLRPLSEMDKINQLRKQLLQMKNTSALPRLVQMMDQHETNDDLIKHLI